MNPSVLAVICSRMGSERFPGKTLAEIAGKPKLQRIIERLQRAKSVSRVVIATSTDRSDEPICRFAVSLNVGLYRGDLLDVADRMDGAIERFREDEPFVFRAMGDQPLLDWQSLDDAAALMAAHDWDLVLPLSFDDDPVYGAGLSPWSYRAWKGIAAKSRGDEREHPGMWLRRNLKDFRYGLRDLPHWCFRPYRLELDTEEDLELIQTLYTAWDRWPEPPPLRWAVSHLDKTPRLLEINAWVREKTGTYTSYTQSEIETWQADYLGRPIVWSDVAGMVGSIILDDHKETRYVCRTCGGHLVALSVVKKKGDLRTRCLACGEARTFYAIKPKGI